MKFKLYFSGLLLFLFFCLSSRAQDFSNKGTDFWVGYGDHVQMHLTGNQNNSQEMVLYFATDKVTSVTVSIPGLGYTVTYPNIPANTIFTTGALPKSGANDARLNTEGISKKGIHITSDQPIVAYAHIYNASISGATLLFPTPTLGKEYYSMNFEQRSNNNNSYCFFYVIATEPGSTTIEVIPSANTQNMVAGGTYTFTLNQGEVFNALGTTNGLNGVDLSGSIIRSISTGSTGCKRIAVFSGSGKLNITCGGTVNNSADNYMVQAFPKTAWGKNYLTVPTKNFERNYYRIGVTDPSTVVKVNGSVLSGLINNFYYQIGPTSAFNVIEADKPVMVAQYITTQNACGNGAPGDPEVIYLSPVEQTIDKVLVNSTNKNAITLHYINIVIPNSGTAISSFKIDGTSPKGTFLPHPQNSAFAYLIESVGTGQHVLQSDSGFNAIAYGYGDFESYGYNAGSNVKDLYQFASIKNQYSTVDFPSACTQSPFFFRMTFPYEPAEMKWVFGTALNAMGFADVTVQAPKYDSAYIKNGRQVYRYTLPNPYTINTAGTYPVKIIAQNPTAEGCSGEQEISFDLQVFDRPKADFTFSAANFCAPDLVKFSDASNTGGRPIIKYTWNVSDGRTASSQNPQFQFNTPGKFDVGFSVITDIGCIAETQTKTVEITPVPTANFDLGSISCETKSVLFKDLSNPNAANVTEWRWNFGDGSAPVINTTNASVAHTFTKAGTYSVTLDLKTNKACASTFTKTITVHPLPQPGFEVPGICLKDVSATFTNTTTISDGTQSALTYNWMFIGASPGTSQAVHPTTNYSTAGTFSVTLEATSVNGCKNSVSQPFTINGSQPKSAFSIQGGNDQCSNQTVFVQNNSSVDIGRLIKLEIFWNDGVDANDKTVTTTPAAGAVFSKTYPEFGSPGTKTYTIRVRAYSGASCFSDFTETLTLKATPQVVFDPVKAVCANAASFQITTAATANAFSGTGVFTGRGVSPSGLFNPKTAGAGTHTIRYTFNGANGCTNYKEQSITVYPVPVVDAGPDRFMLEGGNTTLLGTATGNGLVYLWSPATALSDASILQPVATPTDEITYKLKVTSSDGCEASDDVFVKVLKAPTIPNVFTPNGDGVNDRWDIQYLETYPGAIVKVFNRYGQVVFESRGYSKSWDGTFNGKPLPAGTYYYIVDPKNGRKQISGFVDIVR